VTPRSSALRRPDASCHALIVEDAGSHDPWSNQRWAADHGTEHFRNAIDDATRVVLVLDIDGTVADTWPAAPRNPPG
jgi:hypothetical protein